ncbi:MAG: DUF2797 domain-containing protein [Bacteroidota bacterium]
MNSRLGNVVDYYLPIGCTEIHINEFLGKRITLKYLQKIHCIHCGDETKISYAQGYCYNCYSTIPETDVGILKPEPEQSHIEKSRDMNWSKKNSLVDHYVYLAISSGLKIGVTRQVQAITRWIDQGASQAIVVAVTPNRHLAGIIEIILKQQVPDKTNWRKMLSNEPDLGINLREEKEKLITFFNDTQKKYISADNWITEIKYPVMKYPVMIKAFNFDKEEEFTGVLTGIKGQYLMFDNDSVINIRKHTGYFMQLIIG